MSCLHCGQPLRRDESVLHGECRKPWALGTAFALLIPHDQQVILERLLAERDQVVPV